MFDLFAGCASAEPVFVAAAEQLGQDPRRFVHNAAPEMLFADRVGQILCCARALAAWAGLGAAQPEQAVIAGYSVGELAAWGCAGALDVSSTLRLAQRRATIMDSIAPADGAMAGIVGLRRQILEPLVLRHDAVIAIINGSDSFVVGGHSDGVDACCHEATATGATRAVRIRVTVPSHTRLLAEGVRPLSNALNEATPREPRATYQLLSGIDGDTVRDVEIGRDKLARQICTPVDWAACLESCREAGAELVLELGPGTALSRMAAPLFPAGRVRSTEEFRTMAGLHAWLSRASD
jgi:[acyl-carrier-protein] S-malonyltransferase